jgi:transposase
MFKEILIYNIKLMIRKHKIRLKKKTFINNFKEILKKNKNKLPIKIKKENQKLITDSWFTVIEHNVKKVKNNLNVKCKTSEKYIKSKLIKMILTKEQKLILNKWFIANTEMYNETLNYIRNRCYLFKNNIIKNKLKEIPIKELSFITLRNNLVNERDNIIKNSQLENCNKNTKIYSHILDATIHQFASNIKSAITNTYRGNFKRFRLKFWKMNRPSQTIEIEHSYIQKNKICPKIFGDIKYIYNKKEYQLPKILKGVKINYNRITDEYTLIIPKEYEAKENKDKTKTSNIISLDPGLRTFMTGLSEDSALDIGKNVNKIISLKLKRLNKIKNNENISNKIKKKNETMINRKISNMIDDLHWKTISVLTGNYNNIFLGDMSAKSIVKKNNSVLSPMQKVACLRTKYYQFQQRLKYKCIATKTNFNLIDESYTSKTCSNCGNYNEKLKGEKVYNCKKCKLEIDRDINGCRNIYFKSML